MHTLGVRAKPTAIIIAVYDTEQRSIINVEGIKIPNALSVPDALKYVRNNVLDILREYGIQQAGLRVVEGASQNVNVRRVEIEGVVQEAFASSDLASYFCGQIATIAAKLHIERADFKKYVKGELNFEAVENWKQHGDEEREAILTALGAEYA